MNNIKKELKMIIEKQGNNRNIPITDFEKLINSWYNSNIKMKNALNKISDIINYEYDFYDNIAEIKNDIEKILNEVQKI